MPVIVVGADTAWGLPIIRALSSEGREVRAFVTDPAVGADLKAAGVRVAIGDVSDGSHVAGAAAGAFCAVLLSPAASDERERSFASSPAAVLAGWSAALVDGGVRRAIWVGDAPEGDSAAPEQVLVRVEGRSPGEVAAEVADLDDRSSL